MSEIPAGESWEYEPKWDGFRCLAFRDGKNVELQSKSGQPLARYFPEVVEALLKLKASKFVLDGELVIPAGSAGIAGSPAGQPRRGAMLPASRRQALGSSFDDLLQRIHPAASRVAKLAKETPAHFIIFDLLGDETGHRLYDLPLAKRRPKLDRQIDRVVSKYLLCTWRAVENSF